jgi:hypothetical protein
MMKFVHILAGATLFSCGSNDGPTAAPPTSNGAGVRVTPAVLEIRPGDSRGLEAVVFDASGQVMSSPEVEWRSTNPSAATVSSGGNVSAVAVGFAYVIASSSGRSDSAQVRVLPASPSGPFIEVFDDVRYQEILGWEGTSELGEMECDATAFAVSRQDLLNRVVNELGINRVRLETRSGHENPQDFFTAFKSSRDLSDWRPHRYESVNDNNDPFVARSGGFQFAELDHKVEVVIQPMRALLQARGEKLYVNLNYVDFGPSSFEQSSNPEEYAELIHAAFMHLQSRYGWVPDAVEIILEPDNTQNWRGTNIGRALVATGDRLKASGFRPAFIAPSNVNMAASLAYLDEMLAVPRVLEYLTDISYHRYSGVSTGTLQAIANRANELGLRTAMLEHIAADYHELHQDLRVGQNSSWQEYVLAFCGPDDGTKYYRFDQTNRTASSVVAGSRTHFLRQYFSFVRAGARRVAAASGDSRLDPLAFLNANGKLVVIVKATQGAPVDVRRLPPGTYGVTFTTAQQRFVSLPDVTVGAGGSLQTSIPAAGVVTVYRR